jgi:hypothetical protein
VSAGPTVDVLEKVSVNLAVVDCVETPRRKRLIRPEARHFDFERLKRPSIADPEAILQYLCIFVEIRIVEDVIALEGH